MQMTIFKVFYGSRSGCLRNCCSHFICFFVQLSKLNWSRREKVNLLVSTKLIWNIFCEIYKYRKLWFCIAAATKGGTKNIEIVPRHVCKNGINSKYVPVCIYIFIPFNWRCSTFEIFPHKTFIWGLLLYFFSYHENHLFLSRFLVEQLFWIC